MSEINLSLTLLDELSSKNKKQCIETLIKIHRNIASNPDKPLYRTLKLSNQRFVNEVWKHEGAKLFLYSTGWELQETCIQLPPGTDVNRSLQILINNRDVKPNEREWVESTKIVGLNDAKLREDELRRKALIQKEKDLAELKKDMAERKAIAKRILTEHRNDRDKKNITKPSVALPRGSGGTARMSDHTSQGG